MKPFSTPDERIEIYEMFIEMIDDGETFTMCSRLSPLMEIKPPMNYLPELLAQKPQEMYGGEGSLIWFPITPKGMQQRKKCLLNAIKTCR